MEKATCKGGFFYAIWAGVMEQEGIFETQLFRSSPQTLSELRFVVSFLSLCAALFAALAAWIAPDGWVRILLLLAMVVALLPSAFVAWLLALSPWKKASFRHFALRELRLLDKVLEERRGRFRRFLLYADISQLRALQLPGERIAAVELLSEQGILRLRGYAHMEQLFAELARRRPAQALIEIQKQRCDWYSPRLWAFLALAAGVAVGALAWLWVA